jgi:5-methylcytosine-specific restriction endonuclease McrA
MIPIVCDHCGRIADKPNAAVKRARALGRKLYCSRSCYFSITKRKPNRKPQWHEARFTPDDRKCHVQCVECGRDMWLPASKLSWYTRCGPECQRAGRAKAKEARRRECEKCGKIFYPRPRQIRMGQGHFCSQTCNEAGRNALATPESLARAQAAMRELREAGKISYPKGEDHSSWKGGLGAAKRRRIESGKSAEQVRNYRRRNPEKAREFSHRRSERKVGRLPRGTIKSIGERQRWRCAVCSKSIKKKYHVDHILPLALGGGHEPSNIQLTCPPCNLRKGTKHPIDFMRSLGRLL